MKYTIKKFLRPGWLDNFNKLNKAVSFFLAVIILLLVIVSYLMSVQSNWSIIITCIVIISISIFLRIAVKYLLKAKNILIENDHLIIELIGLKLKVKFKNIMEVGIITPFHLPPIIMIRYDFDELDKIIYLKVKANRLFSLVFVESVIKYYLITDPDNFITELKEKTNDIKFIEKDFTKKIVLGNNDSLKSKRVLGLFMFLIIPIIISIFFIPKVQLKVNSIFSKIHQVKGDIYSKNNNFKAAIKSYKKAVEINPLNAQFYSHLSHLYERLDDYDQAIECGLKAIKIDPNLGLAYQNLAVVYRKHQWYELAIETCKKSISLDANSFIAYSEMGLSYEKIGKYEEAVNAHKQALKKNPNHYFSNFRLALIYIEKGENELAMKEYNVLKDLSPSMAKYLEDKLFDKK